MYVKVTSISGYEDAIAAMFMSKRTWNQELDDKIRKYVRSIYLEDADLKNGLIITKAHQDKSEQWPETYEQVEKWLNSVCNIGQKHITLLKFIDISCVVVGLHRAGQDDWDAHAKRFDNRIIRNSTRLSKFGHEMSDYYKDKIKALDTVLDELGIKLPDTVNLEDGRYVRTVNGYIKEEYKDDQDVERGLYMLSIPSNFIFKINLAEWGHVYKMRNALTQANPEVKECCEAIQDQIEYICPLFNREFIQKIDN